MPNSTHKSDSLAVYLLIYALLMSLLVATVYAATEDMGRWNVVVALAIAAIKATLVILFFMHVRHSSRLSWIFAGAAFLWLGLLLGLTMTDYASRGQPTPSSSAQISAAENVGEPSYATQTPHFP
ncbi:MAG: cytochrome C oxidase subunit IV family protein [Tepidisphaeraceae bacterium]|jgi:cytochrome c oxidase subunit 4